MRHIKLFPHYLKAMVHDIKTFPSVRKIFSQYVIYSTLSLLLMVVLLYAKSGSEDQMKESYLLASIVGFLMSVGWICGWVTFYFSTFYSIIREAYEEARLQRKYSYLYNKFTKESD